MNGMKKIYTAAGWLAVIYIAVLFCFPVCKVLLTSLQEGGSFTVQHYIKIFTGSVYLRVLFQTLWVSVIATLVSLCLGYSLAYFIAGRPVTSQGIWLMAIITPMFMSLTIRFFGWMIFLGKEGPFLQFLRGIGVADKEFTLLFTTAAVVIGIVHYALPFVVLNIYASLKKVEPALLEASTILGASRLTTFCQVTFPLSLPGVFSGGSIAFALAASTFLVPRMLGGPKDMMISNLAYDAIVKIGDMPVGAALSMVLLIIVVIVLVLMNKLERRSHFAK